MNGPKHILSFSVLLLFYLEHYQVDVILSQNLYLIAFVFLNFFESSITQPKNGLEVELQNAVQHAFSEPAGQTKKANFSNQTISNNAIMVAFWFGIFLFKNIKASINGMCKRVLQSDLENVFVQESVKSVLNVEKVNLNFSPSSSLVF